MVLSQSPNSIGYVNDNTQLVANISVPRCHAFEIPHSPSCQLSNPFSCQQMRASFTNDNQHQCIARTVSERASSFGDDDQFMPSRKKRVRLVKDNEDDDHEMDLSSPCRSSYPSLPLSPTVPSTRSTSAHLSSEDHVLIEVRVFMMNLSSAVDDPNAYCMV